MNAYILAVQAIAFLSASGGVGKTTIAAHLAYGISVMLEIPLLGTAGFDSTSVPLASFAVSLIGALVQLAFAADPSLGVLVPLATSLLAASVPLAPPAGIAAPAHPTVPSSASAVFSPPLTLTGIAAPLRRIDST